MEIKFKNSVIYFHLNLLREGRVKKKRHAHALENGRKSMAFDYTLGAEQQRKTMRAVVPRFVFYAWFTKVTLHVFLLLECDRKDTMKTDETQSKANTKQKPRTGFGYQCTLRKTRLCRQAK